MMAGFSQEDLHQLAEETPVCRLGQPQEVASLALFLAQEEIWIYYRASFGSKWRYGSVNPKGVTMMDTLLEILLEVLLELTVEGSQSKKIPVFIRTHSKSHCYYCFCWSCFGVRLDSICI